MSSPPAYVDADRSKAPAGFVPTDADVAFYEQHGWYISPVVLPEALLDAAAAGAERFYAGERDRALPAQGAFRDWRPGEGAPIRNNEFVSLQNDAIRALVEAPPIGAIAARLARTSSIRLLDDQLVYKAPAAPDAGEPGQATAVGWHADHAYWGTCSSDNLLTAWIPFHDVELDRSPLVVIDGSHRWGDLEHTRFFNDPDLDAVEARFRAQGHEVERVPITLKKGQVSFHHCWALHGSLPNRSPLPRLALAVHLQDAANRYRRYLDPKGNPVRIADELLCRRLPNGDPDFSDPVPFPELWPGEARP